MTYNALKFPGENGAGRLSYFQTVFQASEPDILITQEIENEDGADMLLATLNANGVQYARAEFVLTDTFYTANMLFYKTSKVSLISQDIIETPRRDIGEYVMLIDGNPIRFYSCHLKSSEGSQNEQKRLVEITCLRNHLNNLEQGTEFIIVGDMNFYRSSEPAYQKIIADEGNNIGRGQDLSDQVGNWHNNYAFREVHSQSTRENQFGGGVGGGLDDRFDFIFTSYEINNDSGIEYIDSSLTYFGNDGNHFNQSINYGSNTVVPDSVAAGTYEKYGSTKFYLTQTEGGEWKGILVYNTNSSYNPAREDEVQLTAEVYEYYGMTELKNLSEFTILSTGNTIPDPFIASTQQVATEESLEGVLVQVNNVEVTQTQNQYGEWYVDDGTGECQIDDGIYTYPDPEIGDEFSSITGVVEYAFGEYGLNPRSADDFVLPPPQNIQIQIIGNEIHLSWDAVQNANIYKIYRSTNPYGTFEFIGSTSETNFSEDISAIEKFFYRVTALTTSSE